MIRHLNQLYVRVFVNIFEITRHQRYSYNNYKDVLMIKPCFNEDVIIKSERKLPMCI